MIKHLKNLIIPILCTIGVYLTALGLFILIWGVDRFKSDFYPLDRSYVGPNLCASLFLVIAVIGHNEFVVLERAHKMHDSHKKATKEFFNELFHPLDQAEADMAAEVEQAFKDRVLTQLDETTPGGLGTIHNLLTKK